MPDSASALSPAPPAVLQAERITQSASSLRAAISEAVRKPSGADGARLATIDARIREIDRRLAADFPDYAALARPQPLGVEQVQAELRADEALVLFLDTPEWKPTPEETFVWVVTKTDIRWLRSEFGTKALGEHVAALRCGLDQAWWNDSDIAQACKVTVSASPQLEILKVGNKEVTAQVLPFDLARAHELYKALLGPAEDMIKGKHLLIVPSGPLTSLPFHVLVTEPPKAAIPDKLTDYRGVPWLGTRQPISVLPSVASLKALRQFARTRQATKPYLGIGNPLLDGPQDDLRWGAYHKERAELARRKWCSQIATPQQVASARAPRSVRSFTSVFRGAQADIEQVRQFSPLPETADELCDIARRLGVPESEILLGASATETGLKDLSEQGRLADYAVVHFATHGALAGQVQGSTEPGLVLTPPAKGTSDPKLLERDARLLDPACPVLATRQQCAPDHASAIPRPGPGGREPVPPLLDRLWPRARPSAPERRLPPRLTPTVRSGTSRPLSLRRRCAFQREAVHHLDQP